VTNPEATIASIAERIRRPPTAGHSVLEGSLPVVAFGDPSQACVATIALNPSDAEFMDRNGWLDGPKKRLESLHSLGASHASDLSDEQVAQVLTACNRYFAGNWLKTWFGPLEQVLKESGTGSFLDGSVCHLDLVQWATRPKRSDLTTAVWDRLVAEDSAFLRWQLETYDFDVLLINGVGVSDGLLASGLAGPWTQDRVSFDGTKRQRHLWLRTGSVCGVPALAWNLPLDKGISPDGRNVLQTWIREHLPARGPAHA